MNLISTHGGRTAAALFLSVIAPSAAFAARPGVPGQPADRPAARVSAADIAASNRKVGMAYGALVRLWSTEFKSIGERFVAPRVVRYDGDGYTACGLIHANNAEYCPNDNTVYYDQTFVAGMAKMAGSSLGTDGDMAGVGIIAHEMGHAVAIQLGHESRSSYQNEATADCLAGAFTEESGKNGNLEDGDIDEAFYGISLAGDPTLLPTGNRRRDAMLRARLAMVSHGTKDQRLDNFGRGLNGGPGACIADFR